MFHQPSITIGVTGHMTNDYTSASQVVFTLTGSQALEGQFTSATHLNVSGCSNDVNGAIECDGFECSFVCEVDSGSTSVVVGVGEGAIENALGMTSEATSFVLNIGEC